MRICPNCGTPKETHKRLPGVSSKRLPWMKAPLLRVCPLKTVDLVGKDEDIPLRRVDWTEIRMREAAYEEERSLRFA